MFIDTTSGSEREDESTSILDVLKVPKSAAQNRKCKVLTNRGRGKHRCSSSSTSSEPKRVTLQQRLKEFPGERLVISMFKLFCRACREELNLKLSTIRNHIQSVKHVDGKNKVAKKEAREQDIATALRLIMQRSILLGNTSLRHSKSFV